MVGENLRVIYSGATMAYSSESQRRRHVHTFTKRCTSLFKQPPTLSTATLLTLLPTNTSPKPSSLVLVDARTLTEYDTSHIPGAVHISNLPDLSPPNRQSFDVVFYCTTGLRSSVEARRFMRSLNNNHRDDRWKGAKIWNSEGVLSWIHGGGTMLSESDQADNKKRQIVHVFEKRLDLVPKDWEVRWFGMWEKVRLYVRYGGKVLKELWWKWRMD